MRRGLTLLELMSVLAVLAVLVTLALPRSGSMLQRQRLAAAAETLAGDLAEARFEAARRGSALHLRADGGDGWCWTVSLQAGCGCGSAPQGQTAAAPSAAGSCSLKTVRAADHPGVQLAEALQLRLEPDGASVPASATLQAGNGDRLRVELGPTGRARICVPGQPAAGAAARYPRC